MSATIISQDACLPLIVALTPFVVALIKTVLPQIPKQYLPAITPVIGLLIDFVSSQAGLWTSHPYAAAIAGAAGVGLREVYDQLKKAGQLPTSLFVAILSFTIGCSSIAPGADPIVVNAERTITSSFEITDAFLKWEYLNRAKVPQNITKFADEVRVKFPPAMASTRAVLAAYKNNRTPDAKANLLTWLAVLRDIESGVRANLNPNLP